MNDNAEHVLPPLWDDHKVRALKGVGHWETIGDSSALEIIANHLQIEADRDLASVLSIPDPWAHVEIFAAALFDEHSEQNSHAVGEWRGLLAVLALRPYYDYALAVQQIRVPSANREAGGSRDFLAILGTSMPVSVFADGLTWEALATIHVNEQLLGLVCPSTLVVPGRNYRDHMPIPILPWLSEERIVDPLSVEDLHVEHLLTLFKYVDGLAQLLEAQHPGETTRDVADALLRVLREYGLAIRRRLSRTSGNIANPHFVPFPIQMDLPSHAIYGGLRDIWAVETKEAPRFDVALPVRATLADVFKGALIFDKYIPRSLGRRDADIIVWNRSSVEGLLRECPTTEQLLEHDIVEDAALEGYLVLTTDDIFLPNICRTDDPRRIQTHDPRQGEYLLPYSPVMLLFLTPEQLRKATHIEQTAQGVAVTLSLDLIASPSNRPRNRISLRREYLNEASSSGRTVPSGDAQATGRIIEAKWPDTLVMWPNFSHAEWPWNFTFSSANPQLRFTVQSPISVESLGARLRALPDNLQRGEEIRLWALRPPPADKQLPILHMALTATDLFLTRHTPEAISLLQTTKADIGNLALDERRPAGLLLLGQLEQPPTTGDRMTVGIDFGTSNTCIYCRRGDEAPRPVVFKNRIVSPFGKLTVPESDALSDFVQATNIEAPFQSVLKDRGVATEDDDMPVWTDHIYFVEDIAKGWNEALGKGGGNESTVGRAARLIPNLKWSEDRAQRLQVRRFIGQAALMTAAEAVAEGVSANRIHWHFSYPEAFDPIRFNDYMQLYGAGTQFVIGPDGPRTPQRPQISHLPESVAAALYFSARPEFRTSFTETVVTIDIGGHTSDISIWQNRALLWRGSVELAGRHLVSASLAADLPLLKSLVRGMTTADNKTIPIDELGDVQDLDKRRFAVEVLLNFRDFSKSMLSNFPVADRKSIDRLMLLAELVLAALLYHIGHQIRALHELQRFDVTRPSTKICLGGRASQIFPRLFGDYQEALSGVKQMFREAAGIPELEPDIAFSAQPKHEVAYGLVVGHQRGDLITEGHMVDVVMGEQILADGTPFAPDARILGIPRQATMRVDKLVGFDEFLRNLQRLCRIRVEAPASVRGEIVGQVNNRLDSAARTRRRTAPDEHEIQGDTTSLEPPFLMVVREAVAAIIEDRIKLSRVR